MARKRFQRGSLKLRKGKTKKVWVGQWREDVIEGGKIHRRFKKVVLGLESDFPTKKLAQRELDRRLQEINSPTYRPTARSTYRDFATRWMSTVMIMHKPSSQGSEKAHMTKYIMPFFGDRLLSDIHPGLVQEFIAGVDAAPKTVRNVYSTFRTAWKTARQWQLINHNVCEGIRLPRLNPVERPAFTREQMQQIIAAADEPFKTFFWLAAETGMRCGELIGLRKCDVDYVRRTVFVRQSVWNGNLGSPKSAAGIRNCNISQGLASALEANFLGPHKDSLSLVFETRAGRPWDGRFIVRDHLQPLLESLGIQKAGMHAFRHGNATYRLQQGEDVKTLAARLGHSDPSITLRVYAHSSSSHELSNKMGDILQPKVLEMRRAV